MSPLWDEIKEILGGLKTATYTERAMEERPLTHWIQRPHASLALNALVGHIGLSSLSLDLVALVSKTQSSIGSFY